MLRRLIPVLLLTGAMAIGLAGCGEKAQPPAPSATSTHRYEIRGSVISVDVPAKEAVIDHEKIADLMDAMKMSFSVPDAADLAKLQAGKLITATLVVENNAMWIEAVQVIGDAPESPEPAAAHPH